MTTRSDPVLVGATNTNSLNLGITSFCSMRCPRCSIDIVTLRKSKQARHASIDQIKTIASHMQGLRRVHVTGGEPTIHPDFAEIATNVREWFQCEYLTIESNGKFYDRYREIFKTCFDRVFITHYKGDGVYAGAPDNTHVVKMAERDLGDKLIREPPVEHTTQHNRSLPIHGEPCSKCVETGLPAGWYNGKLYACCVTFGIDPNLGIEVTERWREDIKFLEMGCGQCCYQGT